MPRGKRAMLYACHQFGIPHEVRTLKCNGQLIALAQVGELLLFPEPMDHFGDKPVSAAYKQELAASHFAARQLEFDFGNQFQQTRIDCRTTMLVVLQHGMRADRFDERNLMLSMLRVAVPDWSFSSWTWLANAMSDELSLLMDWQPHQSDSQSKQEDRVYPMLKANVHRGGIFVVSPAKAVATVPPIRPPAKALRKPSASLRPCPADF